MTVSEPPPLAAASDAAPAAPRLSLSAWLHHHAVAIQAITGILTILFAVGALIGVKVQIDAAARLQREQSARDIYREYLNLSISRPEFARPDYCALIDTPQEPAYEAYVDYLLYTAEQAIAADPEWRPVFGRTLAQHRTYLCAVRDWWDYGEAVQDLVGDYRATYCAAAPVCAPDAR